MTSSLIGPFQHIYGMYLHHHMSSELFSIEKSLLLSSLLSSPKKVGNWSIKNFVSLRQLARFFSTFTIERNSFLTPSCITKGPSFYCIYCVQRFFHGILMFIKFNATNFIYIPIIKIFIFIINTANEGSGISCWIITQCFIKDAGGTYLFCCCSALSVWTLRGH